MKIRKLYLELSSLCNLRCTTCFRNSWFSEAPCLASDETVAAMLRAIRDPMVEGIFLGGMGEPLMHPRIFEVLEAARACKKPAELITNAVLLDEAMCDRLLQSGLSALWISIDGFTEESYEAIRRGSLFRKILESISIFNRKRTRETLGVTFVMTKENLGELAAANAFLDRYRVDMLNLSHMVPSSPLSPDDCIYELPYRIGKMKRFDPDTVAKKELDTCPFIRDEVTFIRADGEISPCMQLLHNSDTYLYEEKRRVYAHSFGNIRELSISDIYRSENYSAFRERVRDFAFPCCTVCMGCEDRKENVADCMYNERPTCGACLWAQGYIRCP